MSKSFLPRAQAVSIKSARGSLKRLCLKVNKKTDRCSSRNYEKRDDLNVMKKMEYTAVKMLLIFCSTLAHEDTSAIHNKVGLS